MNRKTARELGQSERDKGPTPVLDSSDSNCPINASNNCLYLYPVTSHPPLLNGKQTLPIQTCLVMQTILLSNSILVNLF